MPRSTRTAGSQLFYTGSFTNSTATDTAPMVSSALKSNPDVVAIYAPYDEFTKGTLSALEQNPDIASGIKVYGADISAADIELMTAEGSQWVATGATDPNAIGAAVTRTLSLHMAGELPKGATVDFPPILVTQDFLRSNNIKNMVDLRAAEPALNISDISGRRLDPVGHVLSMPRGGRRPPPARRPPRSLMRKEQRWTPTPATRTPRP